MGTGSPRPSPLLLGQLVRRQGRERPTSQLQRVQTAMLPAAFGGKGRERETLHPTYPTKVPRPASDRATLRGQKPFQDAGHILEGEKNTKAREDAERSLQGRHRVSPSGSAQDGDAGLAPFAFRALSEVRQFAHD